MKVIYGATVSVLCGRGSEEIPARRLSSIPSAAATALTRMTGYLNLGPRGSLHSQPKVWAKTHLDALSHTYQASGSRIRKLVALG